MTVVAELTLDLANSGEKVSVRLFSPKPRTPESGWICRFEISEPIGWSLDVHGVSSLQALALALKGLSAALYGSDLYRKGRLGVYGEFGGYLGIPAPNLFLDEAPYPF